MLIHYFYLQSTTKCSQLPDIKLGGLDTTKPGCSTKPTICSSGQCGVACSSSPGCKEEVFTTTPRPSVAQHALRLHLLPSPSLRLPILNQRVAPPAAKCQVPARRPCCLMRTVRSFPISPSRIHLFSELWHLVVAYPLSMQPGTSRSGCAQY